MKNLIAASTLAATLLVPAITAQAQTPVKWLFGMNVRLEYGSLRIMSVVPGGAAFKAGLRPGHMILRSNNFTFNTATNDFHAIQILQNSVEQGGNGGGGGGGGVPTTLDYPGTPGRPCVHFLIRKPCGTVVKRVCYPDFNGNGGGVPTL